MLSPSADHDVNQSSVGSCAKLALTRAAAIGVVLGALVQPTSAAIEVRGQADALQLRAENASIIEVLKALAVTFKLNYKVAPNSNRVISGLYAGSLHQVLSRILDGNDYIVNVSGNGIEVIVLGASGAAATVSAQPAIVVRENPVTNSAPTNEPSPPPAPPLSSFLSGNTNP